MGKVEKVKNCQQSCSFLLNQKVSLKETCGALLSFKGCLKKLSVIKLLIFTLILQKTDSNTLKKEMVILSHCFIAAKHSGQW